MFSEARIIRAATTNSSWDKYHPQYKRLMIPAIVLIVLSQVLFALSFIDIYDEICDYYCDYYISDYFIAMLVVSGILDVVAFSLFGAARRYKHMPNPNTPAAAEAGTVQVTTVGNPATTTTAVPTVVVANVPTYTEPVAPIASNAGPILRLVEYGSSKVVIELISRVQSIDELKMLLKIKLDIQASLDGATIEIMDPNWNEYVLLTNIGQIQNKTKLRLAVPAINLFK